MALAFPASPTPGQQYTGPNGVVYEWDNALGAWVKVNSVQAATAGTTAATGAARIPSGPAAARPTSPANGFFRFNEDTDKLEVWNGLIWAEVASSNPITDTFVPQTTPLAGTPSAVIPSGNTANRQTNPLPLGGYTRFNTDTTLMEVFDGTIWTPVGAPPNAGLGLNLSGITPNQILKLSVPQQSTPPTPGTLAPEAISGSLYWDDVLSTLFIRYDNGGTPAWVQAAPAAGSIGVTSINVSGGTTGLSFSGGPVTTAGTLTLAGTLGIANGGTGATTGAGALAGLGMSVNASGGTTGLTFSGGPVTSSGTLTLGGTLAVANGGTGATTGAGALAGLGMSVNASGGTTGLTFSGGPVTSSGTLTMAGTLAVANGGTGGTTQPAAINNLLPSQATNAGKFLKTDGTNVSWDTGGAPAATLAEAAAGTINTKYSSPETAVPKTPSGMTGAALIPGGNDGARPAPVTGMLRYNSQSGTPVSMEYYDGSAWSKVGATQGAPAAWAQFNGIPAAPTIYGSSPNITSVVRNTSLGVPGVFVLNFTAVATSNYAIVCTVGSGGVPIAACAASNYVSIPSTTSCSLGTFDSQSGGNTDFSYNSIVLVA